MERIGESLFGLEKKLWVLIVLLLEMEPFPRGNSIL
jgi:hypothetical protein